MFQSLMGPLTYDNVDSFEFGPKLGNIYNVDIFDIVVLPLYLAKIVHKSYLTDTLGLISIIYKSFINQILPISHQYIAHIS